jgi:hypothetical protein
MLSMSRGSMPARLPTSKSLKSWPGVGDDRDQAAGDRVLDLLAEHRLVALVVGMHRDRHVGQHRLRPRRRHLDGAGAVGERIAQSPEMALDVPGFDLQVADRRLELRIPVHEPFVAIGEAAAVELDEHLRHRGGEAGVHGEALVGPVAAGAEAAELAGDGAAGLRLPFPDMLEEGVAADVGALDTLAVEVALDHHLGGDAGMVGADHPERVLALHPGVARQDVLQRVVERMADMQRAGDVGRRHDDGERLGVLSLRAEQALPFPMGIPFGLDRAGLEGLGKLGHCRAVRRA